MPQARTSRYSFQRMGMQGVKILTAVPPETALPIVGEVLDLRNAEEVASRADMV